MYDLHCFETGFTNNQEFSAKCISSSILGYENIKNSSKIVDFTGTRVKRYVQNVEYCDVIYNCMNKYMTNYTLYGNGFKSWFELPTKFNTSFRRLVVKEMVIKKGTLIKSYCDFQKDNMNVTYPNYKSILSSTKLSLHVLDKDVNKSTMLFGIEFNVCDDIFIPISLVIFHFLFVCMFITSTKCKTI
jgi:hypothetical protein